jgi:hypothetical protein
MQKINSIIILATILLLTGINLIANDYLKKYDSQLEIELREISNIMSYWYPQKINRFTTITGAITMENSIYVHHTIHDNGNWINLSSKKQKEIIKSLTVDAGRTQCLMPEWINLFNRGASIIYEYSTEKRHSIAEVVIDKHTCKRFR